MDEECQKFQIAKVQTQGVYVIKKPLYNKKVTSQKCCRIKQYLQDSSFYSTHYFGRFPVDVRSVCWNANLTQNSKLGQV